MASSHPLVDPSITGSEVSTAMHSPHPQGTQDADATEDAASSTSDDAFFVSQAIASNSASASAYAASAAASVAAAAAAAAGNTPSNVHHHASASPAPAPAPASVHHAASPSPNIGAAAPIPAAARVQKYNPALHSHLVLYLAALHGARITSENLSGSFAPPLNHEKLLDWWRVRLTTSAVFLLLRSTPFPTSTATQMSQQSTAAAALAASASAVPSSSPGGSPAPAKVAGPDLVGVIMLRSHPAETSPHVALVELLLVNLQYRQLGGERQLLETVERQALLEGKTLLTAEAESKSNTAIMFSTLGFTEVGQVPGMVLRPSTGEKRALSIFYKDLEQAYQHEQS
ncbi:hypothetical protein Sste5346_003473 [Sporothrix stenoceras]|uniref:N-acetyltransferase domain-containing protein n=1 Tax=Sporothrix stenoceras TaxID=5173 RepID=A0ABR3ZDZ7_9PEZI